MKKSAGRKELRRKIQINKRAAARVKRLENAVEGQKHKTRSLWKKHKARRRMAKESKRTNRRK